MIGLILLIDEYTHLARGNSYLPQEEPKLPSFQSATARRAAILAEMGLWGVWAFREWFTACGGCLSDGSDRVDPAAGEPELFIDFAICCDKHIGSLVSGDGIGGTALAVDVVIAIASDGDIVSASAEDRIAAIASDEQVGSTATIDSIVAIPGRDPIVTALSEDCIVSIASVDQVVAGSSGDPIEAMPTDE